MTNIETTAPAPDVEAASRTLAAILAGTPDVDDALAAAEALSILSDVITPYPPLEYPTVTGVTADVDEAIDAALSHLDNAIVSANGNEAAARCAHAARVLRTRRTRRDAR